MPRLLRFRGAGECRYPWAPFTITQLQLSGRRTSVCLFTLTAIAFSLRPESPLLWFLSSLVARAWGVYGWFEADTNTLETVIREVGIAYSFGAIILCFNFCYHRSAPAWRRRKCNLGHPRCNIYHTHDIGSTCSDSERKPVNFLVCRVYRLLDRLLLPFPKNYRPTTVTAFVYTIVAYFSLFGLSLLCELLVLSSNSSIVGWLRQPPEIGIPLQLFRLGYGLMAACVIACSYNLIFVRARSRRGIELSE